MQILKTRSNATDADYLIVGWSKQECLDASVTTGELSLAEEYVTRLSDLLATRPPLIAFLPWSMWSVLHESAVSLLRDVGTSPDRSTIVLLERKSPPVDSRRHDGVVNSFCCGGALFADLMESFLDDPLEDLCFNFLHSISNLRLQTDRLLIRQLPYLSLAPSIPSSRTGVVMAHRGKQTFLQAALTFLCNSDSAQMLDLHLGVDTDDPGELHAACTVGGLESMSVSRVVPAPAGPYVIRQHLIEQCCNSNIAFHDSDDISTDDRVSRQVYELKATGADLVGCHELRLDEIERRVEAIRFPIDVSGALDVQTAASSTFWGDEPLLHATATVVRKRFIEAGGFSTDQRIANDTQFMLRAYFSLKMRNVDEFLYVRRVHKTALTSSPETALGTSLRRSLAALWKSHFDAIKAGSLQLSESSLIPRRSVQQYIFVPCETLASIRK